MNKNHRNINDQEGKVYIAKPKKNLALGDAIIGIITALLVAHFGAKFFEGGKKEILSMSAIAELQVILQNVKKNKGSFYSLYSNLLFIYYQLSP